MQNRELSLDKFEELIWPAFIKYCSERENIFDIEDLVKRNVVKVTDGVVQLRKPVKGGSDKWAALDKELVRAVFNAMANHKNRITLGELKLIFPNITDLNFVFTVFTKLENVIRYDWREKRIYLK